jgi:hypothetical protein
MDPEAHGAADESGSDISFRSAIEGACDDASGSPSATEGACDDASGNPSATEAACDDASGSPSAIEGACDDASGSPSAIEGAVLEGLAQTAKISSTCCSLICCHKKLLFKLHVKVGSNCLVGSTHL